MILAALRHGKLNLIVSDAILEEYGEVLRRTGWKFELGAVDHFMDALAGPAERILPETRIVLVDPDDCKFLDARSTAV